MGTYIHWASLGARAGVEHAPPSPETGAWCIYTLPPLSHGLKEDLPVISALAGRTA